MPINSVTMKISEMVDQPTIPRNDSIYLRLFSVRQKNLTVMRPKPQSRRSPAAIMARFGRVPVTDSFTPETAPAT